MRILGSKRIKPFEQDLSKFYIKKKSELIEFFRKKYNFFNADEIEEIFQDAFFSLYNKILDGGDFPTEIERSKYLWGTMDNMFKVEYRRTKKIIYDYVFEEDTSGNNIQESNELIEGLTKTNLLQQFVQHMTDPCKTIIEKFYWEELTYNEILIIMPNFSSTDALKAQKYKCMQRISEKIKIIFAHQDLI